MSLASDSQVAVIADRTTYPRTLAARFAERLSVKDFGAKGDGVTDDTAAIQAALTASASTGRPAFGVRGDTYLCRAAGTKSFINPSGATITKSYCVQVPSGASLDLNGATLKIASGLDAVLLSNTNTAVAGDVISVRNVVVDGNSNVPTVPLVWFWGCSKSSFRDITLQNVSFVAGQVAACTDCNFDRLVARSITGQGWIIGGNTSDQVSRCTIGTVEAYNITTYGTVSQPGNGVFFGGIDSSIEVLRQRNCGGGIKFGPNCSNVECLYAEHDGLILAGESDHNTSNCGIKIQGDDAASKSTVRIGRAVARRLLGSGLFVNFAGAVWIGAYDGASNGLNATDPDVSLANFDKFVAGEMRTNLAGAGGISIGTGAGYYDINQVELLDIANDAAATSKVGLLPTGGHGHIGSLRVWQTVAADSSGKNAIQFTSSNVPCIIDNYASNYTGGVLDIRVQGIVARNVLLDSGLNPLSFEYTPAVGTTTNDISNNNIRSVTVTGGFVEPLVIITPMNAAAFTLGTVRYTIPANRSIRFTHSAAAGTERFSVRILEYEFRAAQFA